MEEKVSNIKYTAADIEKYWKGQLNTSEMHLLEKAAMDDPFLADALEGYQHSSHPSDEVENLHRKLDERISKKAIVLNLKTKKYTWLRVAAAIIIITGIGLLLQQQVFIHSNNNKMANIEKQNSTETNSKPIQPATTDTPDTITYFNTTTDSNRKTKSSEIQNDFPISLKNEAVSSNKDTFSLNERESNLVSSLKESTGSVKEITQDKLSDDNKNIEQAKQAMVENVRSAKPEYRNNSNQNAGIVNVSDKKDRYILNNKYNYRVIDNENRPVPFANVTNIKDNVGTYTDINGTFNLVSNDSVMNVQIKSLGYNSANYKLVPAASGDLTIAEDEQARQQIMAENKKVVSNVTRKDTAELEEPEVGWGFYNTYIANNIQLPENFKPKNASSVVELSFDIDKDGQPFNIKVTKSSKCKECDEEAIRLLREGPKWTRKSKRSKTKVKILVDQ